jgi:HSP20 family protein
MPSAGTETKKTHEKPEQSGTTSQQQTGSSTASAAAPGKTQQGSGSLSTTSGQDQGIARRGSLTPTHFPSTAEFFANPFGAMLRMHEDMDRAFAEAFGASGGQAAWAPAIDIEERQGNLVVHAELPGIRPEDVQLEVNNDSLVLSGRRERSEEQEEKGVHRRERMYGSFYRAIPLPDGADPDKARAQFNNGLLEITIPLPQRQSQSRRIPINRQS